MDKSLIIPDKRGGGCRTGTLMGVTAEDITATLGFKPNCEDDPDKVVNSWGFKVDNILCGIWDYKGSHAWKQFSTYGPDWVFMDLFGVNYQKM